MQIIAKFSKALFIGGLLFISACQKDGHNQEKSVSKTDNSELEKYFHQKMDESIRHLVESQKYLNQPAKIDSVKHHFVTARRHLKSTELILAFLDRNNHKSMLSPNLLRVEEEDQTDVKVYGARGFQVIEEGLVEEQIDVKALSAQFDWLISRMKLVRNNTAFNKIKKHHLIWMVREALVRSSFAGISGFDSPGFDLAYKEAIEVNHSLVNLFEIYGNFFQDKKLLDKFKQKIVSANEQLNHYVLHPEGEFNAYGYFKYHFQPIVAHVQLISDDWKVEYPFELALKNNLTTLFSDTSFNLSYFSDSKHLGKFPQSAALGKALFNDPRLSQSGKMSCASCHEETKGFSTHNKTDFGNTRNSPPIAYSHLQKGFFFDKRAGSLEGQVVGVVHNKIEFNTTMDTIVTKLKNDSSYMKLFREVYPEGLTEYTVRKSIANYVRSLAKFKTKFDQAMNSQDVELTPIEQQGFNLFMSKAQCATCHFPPAFNGTVPPQFAETELENLGVPADSLWKIAKLDADPGRQAIFGTSERRAFFKTPTLRNSAKSAPYMHNGVYSSLEQVIKFYNVGGGEGIGIHQELQTLPPDSLGLNDQEVKSIIAFLETLSD